MKTFIDHSYGVIPVYISPDGPQYLLLKQHNGYWSFPKGHPEEGETAQETALRELREEAGIHECTLLPIPPTSIHYSFTRDEVQHQKTVTLFAAEVTDRNVTVQPEEIAAYEWLPYEEACTRFHFSANIEALTAVHQALATVQNSSDNGSI